MSLIIFGVFDLLHPGHLFFINKAKIISNENNLELIAVITRDKIVQELKNKIPIDSEDIRLKNVSKYCKAILGDNELGSYNIFKNKELIPKIICLGFDQNFLYNDLENKINIKYLENIQLIKINESYKRELYSSTRLRNNELEKFRKLF
jgi:FAD synthetase